VLDAMHEVAPEVVPEPAPDAPASDIVAS